MNYTNLHYQIAVNQLNGIGPVRLKQLLESVASLNQVFDLSVQKLSQLSGISSRVLQGMQRESALLSSTKTYNAIQHLDLTTKFYTDEDFPVRLKECHDPPFILYQKGDQSLNNSRFVAIVGTRNATEYGRRICAALIQSFKNQNIVVVSGLAYGIDVEVHKQCLKHGVPTIGVLANGLDYVYPRMHSSIANEMCLNGALISEYPPGTSPEREHFPMRNRIVAGLCDATIVIESSIKGGSLITANLANDYSRDVFAFPGSIYQERSKGCNQLIAKDKAHLITSGEQFLEAMNWKVLPHKSIQKTLFDGLSSFQKKVVKILLEKPAISLDNLAFALKKPISEINFEIMQLEIEGVVKSLPGKRCSLA